MTDEQVAFFFLMRNYAEPKYRFSLAHAKFDPPVYQFTFESAVTDRQDVRLVSVFEDQFKESIGSQELADVVKRNIDEALSS
jgi:hypothetical protein